jgi:glucose-6-phosphate 1-dehydrogenase
MSQEEELNPLREGMPEERTVAPAALVIFGASGDLTRRKLIPAVYNLALSRLLPGGFAVVGVARRPKPDFAAEMRDAVGRFSRRRPVDDAVWGDLVRGVSYVQGSFDDAATYASLGAELDRLDRERGTRKNRVFYLAVGPDQVPLIVRGLREAGLIAPMVVGDAGPFQRVVVEKPFGEDLPTAQEMNRDLLQHLAEPQIYRIDHYLGKETVQNLLAFRFANGIFESLWNRDRVDNVQITVSEELGVEGRAGYYDGVGAVRDMMQNHLLQLLALVTMEVPVGFNPAAVRYEKTKALTSIAPIRPEHLVLGQYGRGTIDGAAVPAYRDEPGIAAGSRTPTFAAVRLELESWRWKGVPFYLRTGKRLARKLSRISIVFRDPPVHLFGPLSGHTMPPNVFDLTIQPDEGMSLSFQVKAPGQAFDLVGQRLDFGYARAFGPIADAYETLLYDVVEGDQTYFVSSEAIDVGWRLYTPLLRQELPVHEYAAGSWGPDASAALLARDGRSWRPEGAGPAAAPQARAGAEPPSRVEST